MIRFTLQCADGHRFESWFRDGDAYQALSGAGELMCPACGSTAVEKSLMTPQVRPARTAAPPATQAEAPDTAPTAGPARVNPPGPVAPTDPGADSPSDREQVLAAFKAKVESEADYVGLEFVREARAIHAGDAPERPIYGEAKPAEAVALIEDGVHVAPLPFVPTRKVN